MKHKKILLNVVRRESRRSPKVLVLEDKKNRQFFRYDRGELVEYDLTKFNGSLVRLTNTEKTAAKRDLR